MRPQPKHINNTSNRSQDHYQNDTVYGVMRNEEAVESICNGNYKAEKPASRNPEYRQREL
jgi:hypothetical protein